MNDKALTNNQANFEEDILHLLELIVKQWAKLDKILQAEWTCLLSNDFSKLYLIFKTKQTLARSISDAEKNLSNKLIEKLEPALQSKQLRLSERLIDLLGSRAGSKALRLLKERNHYRQLVSLTNQRIILWLKDRLSFFDELSQIFSGATLKQEATYCPKSKRKVQSFSTNLSEDAAPLLNKNTQNQALNIYNILQNTKSAKMRG